ncbi:MotA/TolQ/ExbB proton channel family protein [Marinobacter adhaerens]|jgi:biopolymer transport protein ExbB|uniref:MotA/TolQ/ExbB proton channel family protein n=1 Tax=Marinobacter adhaerens TaxID=1033846 RepID=UPI003D28F0C1
MLAYVADFLLLGGPVVWLLGIFSVVALTFVLAKLFQLAVLQPGNGKVVKQALSHFASGERNQAAMLVKGGRRIREQLLGRLLSQIENADLSLEALRQESTRQARLAVSKLASYLRPLEVIATLAPLLGLFGTVLGMIEAFQAMEAAGRQVNPSVLSGGIWKALLTTAVGLAVAIPVSLAHSWLERKAEASAGLIQNDLEQLLTLQAAALHRSNDPALVLKRA